MVSVKGTLFLLENSRHQIAKTCFNFVQCACSRKTKKLKLKMKEYYLRTRTYFIMLLGLHKYLRLNVHLSKSTL